MNIIIAILSAGAMGSAISVRLKEHGARVLTLLDGRSAATVDRARSAGMEDVSPKTIAAADLILSIVPPGEAVALAKGLVTRLNARVPLILFKVRRWLELLRLADEARGGDDTPAALKQRLCEANTRSGKLPWPLNATELYRRG